MGVIASLSRGVWLSAGLGLGAIVFVAVTAARWQVVMGTLVLAALGVVGVVQLYDQLTGKIIEKSHRFSESALFEDARWEHWSDSWRLAQTYFPVGAGIGTYPYAQLDQQQHEQAGWLKQAHNQYLETFAEGGVIAIVLVLAMFGYALQSSWRLFTGATSGEQLGMGAMGAMVLMIAFFHSFVDFVIAMPANLLALALIAGAVLTAGEQTAMRDFRFRSVRRLGIWCVAALLCGIASERMLYRSVAVEKTLTASELPERADPSLSTCAAMIQKIEAALPITGQQYAILQRLAAWQALKSAQIHKQAEATERNASIAAVWANLLSVGIQSLQHATTDHPVLSVRDATVLESAVGHLRDANRDNPFVAQSHLLQAQVLGVLGDSQWRLSAERSRRISKLNPELFFINGLMAYASNDDSVMIEEFQRCLRFSSRFDTAITAVALEKLSPRELANELLPDEPEVVVRFIGNANPTSPLAQERSTLIERAKRLLKEPRTTSDYQMLASLAQFEGNAEQSIAYLRTAVETDPRDSRLRMELANQLLALNKFDAAFEQTTLARSLGANQASVVALQKQILHKSNINQLIHKNTEAAP